MNIFEITEETTNARGETYLPPVNVNNKEINATLVFSKRPTGKSQTITFQVDAVNGSFGDEWHDTYNKIYDSEKQWRAAHARYLKKYAAQQNPKIKITNNINLMARAIPLASAMVHAGKTYNASHIDADGWAVSPEAGSMFPPCCFEVIDQKPEMND